MMIRLPEDDAIRIMRHLATVAEATKGGSSSWTGDFYTLMQGLDTKDASRVGRLLVEAIGREKDTETRWWLAAGLCLAAERMDPGVAVQVCGPVIKEMAKAITTKKTSDNLEYNEYLVAGFTVVGSKLDRMLADQAARVLAAAIERETDANSRSTAAHALSLVATRMEPTQAARLCGEAGNALATAIEREKNHTVRAKLSDAFSSVAIRMEPIQAARVCGQAARSLSHALERESNTEALSFLTSPLVCYQPYGPEPSCSGLRPRRTRSSPCDRTGNECHRP